MGVVALIVFGLLHAAGGDPATILAGDNATPEDVERVRRAIGLDRDLASQFILWISQILQGDLGRSIFSKLPVTELIAQRLEPTLSLAIVTIVVSAAIAVPLGLLAAKWAGTWLDRAIMILSVIGFSVPAFVLGYALIYVFSLKLDLLPVQGFTSIREGLGPFLRQMILPTLTLGMAYIVLITRITRASVLEVLNDDFIRTARAKGVSEASVLFRHALGNAAIPILTVIGIGFTLLVGGVVIIETVFNIPGVGRLVVDAILKRDYPVIQGVILMFSGVYVAINLAIDILYAFFDPRIRY
jgi:peptide/nickel transport system permease protein